MKKETKELIKWAMSLIADYRVQNIVEHSNFRKNTPAAQNSEIEIKNCNDFAEFLDSLPEIESHLCRGGYIQDKNGIPCCEGDKIRAITSDGSYEAQGVLTWANYYFCLYDEKKGYCNHILSSNYIYEKV